MGKRLSDDEKRFFTDQISLLKNENERLTDRIEELEAESAALKRGIGELQQGLAFFKAIIQAGEAWTYVAQERYDNLLTAEGQEGRCHTVECTAFMIADRDCICGYDALLTTENQE